MVLPVVHFVSWPRSESSAASIATGSARGRFIVPGQIRVVSQLTANGISQSSFVHSLHVPNVPWFDQLDDQKSYTEDNADASNDNVGNPQERISPTHDGASRDDNSLCATVQIDVED